MTADQQKIIDATAAFVEEKFTGEATGHDWWHMYRVWQLTRKILLTEPEADPYVAELGALLHDIADWKFHDGDEEAGPKAAREWLVSQKVSEDVISHIEDIIRTVSFKGAGVPSNMKTIEGKIVHDADKLDAIGAIGIARAFSYGSANGRSLYTPGEEATMHASFEEYKNKEKGHTINHFYEKLLLLKDRMYTTEAQKMAADRTEHMEEFLKEFFAEWEGER